MKHYADLDAANIKIDDLTSLVEQLRADIERSHKREDQTQVELRKTVRRLGRYRATARTLAIMLAETTAKLDDFQFTEEP